MMEFTDEQYEQFDHAHKISIRVIKFGEQKAQITPREKQICEYVFRILTDKTWRGCSNCWQELYTITDITNLQKQSIMSEQKFALKPGKQIQIRTLARVYTSKNLTDEAALAILSTPKGHLHLGAFERYPENWRDLVAAFLEKKSGKPGAADAGIEPKKKGDEKKDEKKAEEVNALEQEKATMRASLEEKTKSELQELCKSYEYPESEWKKKTGPKLVDYLIEKQFAEPAPAQE